MITTKSKHEMAMETTRTSRRSATKPNAPASNIRLFTSEIVQASHDVDMSSSLSFRFCAARRRRNVRANGYRREFAAISPFRLFPLPSSSSFVSFVSFASTSAYVSSASDSTPASDATLSALFLFSVRVIIESTAILLIMSVDVTGHTAKTRTALYSSMPSRSDRTKGTSSAKSSA